MDSILEIKDLNFKYNEKVIFENLNINIEKGDFVTVAGQYGKTTLVKIIQGIIPVNAQIKINNILLEKRNISKIIEQVYIVENDIFKNNESSTVFDEIRNSFTKKNFLAKNKKIDEIIHFLDIKDILDYDLRYLSIGEKQLVALAIALIKEPKILILDDSFNMLNNILKDKIFKILKKLNTENKMTIINFTNNLEESLYSKRIILIDKKVVFNKLLKDAFNEEKIYNELGLELPFMVKLSKKLSYYGLVDKIFLNMDKMVDYIWK